MKPKTDDEIAIMRVGGKMLATLLQKMAGMVEPGVRPVEISKFAAAEIKKQNLQPVVLGYDGFPDVMCISVNEAIVHGVPQKTPFKEGDVVKLDLTLGYKGLVTDSAVTVIAGDKASADVQRLVEGTKRSLEAGIVAIKGGGTRVGDISAAVQKVLEKYKLGIIRELVGHGVGYDIHEQPNIPNYGTAGTGPTLLEGMTICVEPMASLGDWPINMQKDGTVLMRDGSIGAHFEHTILITKDSAEILTLP